MSRLTLRLLGPPHLELDGASVQIARRKSLALLAYLALTRQRYTREALATLFWPEASQKRAYASLRNALWQINQTMGEGWLLAEQQSVALHPDADLWLDVTQFRHLLIETRRTGDDCNQTIPLLSQAAALYHDHFLAGFSLKDAPDFEEWTFFEAEGLRRELAEALERLVRCQCAVGQAEAAIPYARRWLALDPLNETAHYQLMLVYEDAGQHSAALHQYQEYVRLLDQALGDAPQPETTALYEKLRTAGGRRQTDLSFSARPRPRSNLPTQLTSFIGRDKEMAELKLLLGAGEKDKSGRARLISLMGPGGTGKTRLSLQVAAQMLDTFGDGVWLVELASLGDPSLVAETVACALGLREELNRSIMDTLLDSLRARNVLLILDNCEHLVRACAHLAENLLRHCSGLTILASSREALRIPGEIAYQVPPLSVPPLRSFDFAQDKSFDLAQDKFFDHAQDRSPGNDLDALRQYESIRLFMERAAATLPGFTLTEANATAVVQICRRLDGLPLAIELAVARTPLLRVEQIAARLEDRFQLLTGGSRTALPRHQTLQALIDWSYDLLAPTEQRLLCRLSVFAGGFTLAAAEAVCADKESRSRYDNLHSLSVHLQPSSFSLQPSDVLDLLTQLVNKSLVVAERKQGEETRYRLLETIREYAQEKLRQVAEEAPINRKHLGYFLRLAEQAEPELLGPNQAEWVRRLDRELDNLRAALKWSIEHPSPSAPEPPLANSQTRKLVGSPIEAGLQLASALRRYWEVHNPLREGTDWLAQLLEQPVAGATPATRARALAALALLKISRGEPGAARSLAEESLALYRESGDRPGMAFALYSLGYSASFQDDYETGRSALLESLALFRELGDRFGVAEALGSLGSLVQNQPYTQACAYLEESLALYRELGHSAGIASRLANLGLRALWHQEYAPARAWLEEALGMQRHLSAPEVADCLYSLGVLSLRQADYAPARAYFEECIALSRETGHAVPGLWSLVSLGYVALRQGDEAQAGALFAEAQQSFQKMESKIGVVYTVEGLASLAVAQGRWQQCVRLFAWADAMRQAIGNRRPPVEQADVDRDFATIRAHLDEAAITAAHKEGQTLTIESALFSNK